MNLRSFHRSTPFESLLEKINSDHASIGLHFESINILANNISNPEYHKYYNEIGGAFVNTPMNCRKDDLDLSKRNWLQNKTINQVDEIVQNFKNGEWNVQIIVESYVDFIDSIKEQLDEKQYVITSVFNDEPHNYQDKNKCKNITSILVNLDKLDHVNSFIKKVIYKEDEHKFESTLIVPIVVLKNKLRNNYFIVVGVHIPGCNSQFPLVALQELHKILGDLCNEYDLPIIIMGDFNTIPENLEQVFSPLFKINKPLYPTHINPRCEIAVYDNIMYYLPADSDTKNIYQYPVNTMNESSNLFVNELVLKIKESL
jgi:hypothetical protein